MAPSILKIAKEYAPILGIKSSLAISLTLPKICIPTVTTVKVVPTLKRRGKFQNFTNLERGLHYSIKHSKYMVNI
jgi:hypothetical protein